MLRFSFIHPCSCGVEEKILKGSARYRSVSTAVLCQYGLLALIKERRKLSSPSMAPFISTFRYFSSSAVVTHRRCFLTSAALWRKEKGEIGGSRAEHSTTFKDTSSTCSTMNETETATDNTTEGPNSAAETSAKGSTSASGSTADGHARSSSIVEEETRKGMDMHTKVTGMGGKFAIAEKVAALQEKTFSFTPPAGTADHSSCCTPSSSKARDAAISTDRSSKEEEDGFSLPPTHVLRPIMPAPLPPPLSRQEAAARVEEALNVAVASPARSSSAPSSVLGGVGTQDGSKQVSRLPGTSIERLLVEGTIESIRASSALKSRPKGGSHRGVQRLLDYNKQWAAEVSRFNPTYFADLATEQKPEYLWIGCSDSRVPANEIVGLHPGDVFVHRNIGNIFSLSDLNCLSALQFAVDCLKVEHVIVAGHYKCGGVTAAMQGQKLGLTEHWIMQVTDIKNRWWGRVTNEIPECDHLNVLCELNVIEQLYHVVSCCVIQRRWRELDAIERSSDMEDKNHILVRDSYAKHHPIFEKNHRGASSRVLSKVEIPVDVEVHGWVYSLDDGMLRPLLRITRKSNIEKAVNDAREAIFVRYALT